MKIVFLAFWSFFFSTISFGETFSLLVRTVEGKTIIVKVSPETLVIDLKEKISEKTGIPKEITRLSRSGRPLIDDETLSNQNIGEGATVLVHWKMLSNKFIVNK